MFEVNAKIIFIILGVSFWVVVFLFLWGKAIECGFERWSVQAIAWLFVAIVWLVTPFVFRLYGGMHCVW